MILIRDGLIVTQNETREVIEKGSVVVDNDEIVAIGKTSELENKYKKEIKKTIEAGNKAILPGFVNAHTHASMSLLRGYADDLPLEEWWFKKVYPAESKFTKEHVYLGAILGGLEMAKAGVTCFADFYFFEDEVAKAVTKLGLRANLGIAVLDFGTFAFEDAKDALLQAEKTIENWQNDKLIEMSLAPHMMQTTSLETYKACREMAKKYGLLIQTHLSESKKEVDYCIEKYGNSPAKLLIENGILDKNSMVVHNCWLSDEEVELLAENEIKVAHCPISNMKLASGVMPLEKMLKTGITVALGTDGACSNNNLDMFGEMKVTALLHKSVDNNPIAADARTVLDMATIGGAKALHMENLIGSLEVGKKADLIIINLDKPHLTPLYDIFSHLVYSAKASDVETVIVGGKIVMENQKVLTCNEKEILSEARQIKI